MTKIVDIKSEEFQSAVKKVAERLINDHMIVLFHAHTKNMAEFKCNVEKHFVALEKRLDRMEEAVITRSDLKNAFKGEI